RDVEVKHTLLAYELGREWPEDISWTKGFVDRGSRALDAAKTAFHAHIRETSKDTLKSLGELRKTLTEEVSKTSQQTRELLSTLWRDFVIAITAILGRAAFVLSGTASADSDIMRVMLGGIAVFLAFSLIFTLRANSRF